MPNATEWEGTYDERTLECTAARITVALEPTPRVWPITGPLATFNPDGHPLSEPIPPADATATLSD